MRGRSEQWSEFRGAGRGHLFHISFSGWNQPFSLAALQVILIGRIGVTPEVGVALNRRRVRSGILRAEKQSVSKSNAMSITNWYDRDFEELLRRASELGRNHKDSRSSVSRLRAVFNASQIRRETPQTAKVWCLVRVALWSVLVLLGIAGIGVLVILRVKL